ncbi:hypothetical protein B0H13DRAFT_1896022 [Mycena leptocephala]|nr:hypothetical protein B0H13DRAFT_1896022 [Mycena leptocephala]
MELKGDDTAAEDVASRRRMQIVRVRVTFETKGVVVERNLCECGRFVLFDPEYPHICQKPAVPVSNMSEKPRMIRRGRILGTLTDPQEYFDKPFTEETKQAMLSRTAMITAIIQAKTESDSESFAREEGKGTQRLY